MTKDIGISKKNLVNRREDDDGRFCSKKKKKFSGGTREYLSVYSSRLEPA